MGMGIDGELQLWASGALNSVTNYSTNAYDQATAGRHIENSEEMGMAVYVSAFTAGTSDAYTFKVISDSVGTPASPSSPATVATMTLTAAQVTALLTTNGGPGSFFLAIGPNTINQQYISGELDISNTPGTITLSAYLMLEADFSQNVPQPANYTL
jgi:hypothetical protein